MCLESTFCYDKCVYMAENQVIALKGRNVQFKCLDGVVWITANKGGERIITSGQHTVMDSGGKICIQAFAPSVIQIRKTEGSHARVKAIRLLGV